MLVCLELYVAIFVTIYLFRTTNGAECSISLASDKPCIVVYLDFAQTPITVATTLMAYFWSIYHARDARSLLKSHRERIDRIVSRTIARGVCVWLLLDIILIGSQVAAMLNAPSIIKPAAPHLDRTAAMISLTIQIAFVNLGLLPCLAFIALIYTEFERLNFVVEDFLVLLRTEPFDFKVRCL